MVSNPNSTTQTPALMRYLVPRIMAVPGVRLLSRMTSKAGEARRIVAGLTREDYDAILVLGGDGTVNEVINGLLGDPAEHQNTPAEKLPILGVIPTGSANVFARALGFPNSPRLALHVLIEALEAHHTRQVSLGTWNKHWFAVNAGFGIDADVIQKVERARSQGFSATPLRYLHVAAKAWRHVLRKPPAINVQAVTRDRKSLTVEELPLCMVSNTDPWTYLGPLPVVPNPKNSLDTGLSVFGVTDLHGLRGLVSVFSLMGVPTAPSLKWWVNSRIITLDDAASIDLSCDPPQLFQVDGELVGLHHHVELGARSHALEVFVPQNPERLPRRAVRTVLRDFIRL